MTQQKAILYARYSTDQQKEASIEDQFRACERIARTNDCAVVARFEDRGVSGGTADRPGYQMLLAAARTKTFDLIIVEDISRLWRNRSEYGARSAELEDLGIHILTCVGDDTRRDGYGLVLGIKQAIAEHQRREISYRTKRGLEGRAIAGQSTGGRRYGYDGSGAVVEAQAAVIRQIFQWAAWEGLGARVIARRLNESKTPAPRTASQWHPSAVNTILTNRRYTGAVIYGATEGRTSAANSRHKTRTARTAPLFERFDKKLQIVAPYLFEQTRAQRTCRVQRKCASLNSVDQSVPEIEEQRHGEVSR